jgi:hypothetical protein
MKKKTMMFIALALASVAGLSQAWGGWRGGYGWGGRGYGWGGPYGYNRGAAIAGGVLAGTAAIAGTAAAVSASRADARAAEAEADLARERRLARQSGYAVRDEYDDNY